MKISLFILFSLVFAFQSFGSECEKIDEVVRKCFISRESDGKLCKEPPFKEKILIKACEMGCMSESLYEVNMTAQMLKQECKD